ncbi:hypothetical protein [Bacillus sp. B-jedd]|uniref:hypothetical protein n=1 Tax=Bacillus sp. B-jedd TaxID=1476857 RepID=UPI00051562CE|nr:hypothetical protein [Bacillus sp. B-jedd]CEG27113.1 hypothetical protein BN1002_01969 [Bacillus sp. B-jedd]
MKRLWTFLLLLVFVTSLAGCFAEDYDVGVPTAHLNFDITSVQLKEANISWKTASENVQKTVKDIDKFVSSLDELKVFSGQKGILEFKENEKNGGDIWTDPDISVALLKNSIRIEIPLDDSGEFQFPSNKGSYILEVDFKNSAGKVQYIGNIVIQ